VRHPPGAPEAPLPDLVRFTEAMSGWVSPEVTATHEAAAAAGRAAGTPATFILTVVTPDVDALVADPDHRAPAFGCVLFPALHPRPIAVERGHLDLFVDTDAGSRVLHMRYGLHLRDEAGNTWFLRGIKEVVRRSFLPTVLADTTTLFVDVRRGGPDGAPAWRGVLTMGPGGVTAQGLSFRGAGGWFGMRGIVRYMAYYVRRVATVYLGPRTAPLRPGWAAR
jgi:cholesterol oxidase